MYYNIYIETNVMPFYNTNSPTPTTANNINNVSINIRDFLLNKNISSTYPSLSTAVNGSPRIGQPVLDTESNHLNFYPHQKLEGDTTTLDVLGSVLNGQGVGIGQGGSVVPNFDIRSSLAGRVLGATGLLNDTKIGTIGAQQLALALANNAAFNVQQTLLGSLNVQDNVLSLIKGNPLPGFRPSYQITIPSTTGGRVADFAGKMLGFTIPRSYLSDEGSIFQSENGDAENIDRANEMLKYTGKGQALALIANARANLSVNSTSTPFRSGFAPAFTNNKGDYANNSIGTDAKLYAYDDGQGHFVHLLGSNEGNGLIPNLLINREQKTSDSGFKSPEDLTFVGHRSNQGYNERKISDIGFSWGSTDNTALNVDIDGNYSPVIGDKKSLLVKTQKLFNSVGMRNIVTTKGDMNHSSSQISQANGNGFSKGNAVMSKGMFVNGRYQESKKSADETYCRSWTTLDRYDRINKLVRSGADSRDDSTNENSESNREINGLYKSPKDASSTGVAYRDTKGGSVGSILGPYGNPQITPFSSVQGKDDVVDPKRYMFSIENLAWSDRTADLPSYEVGNGDLITNKKGRIMWFPPYDIAFAESSSVNWESTNFIGRGEPVYTYNNTERSGTLSFKVVVDHPSHINAFRGTNGPDDHYINSFWAGCIPPEFSDKLTVSETSTIEIDSVIVPQKMTITPEVEPKVKLVVYFPNDQATIPPSNYENGLSGASPTDYIDYNVNTQGDGYGIKLYPANYTPGIHQQTGWFDNTNYGLNGYSTYSTPIFFNDNVYFGWRDRAALLNEVNVYLKEKCPNCYVEVKGFASQQGLATSNNKLVDDRADNVIAELKQYLFTDLSESDKNARFRKVRGDIPTNPFCKVGDDAAIDKKPCKEDRRAEITFKFDENLAAKKFPKPDMVQEVGQKKITKRITDRFYNETLYFERLTDADPLVFDSFREKIKYFHPAFHSTTPEGLNSRLNFLLQCTRQGPTFEAQGPNNLAFGRPPVCILRIGDFYNTKIVMDNVSIDYEPLVWDLNPEGIGVQPMIANVSISFKFIGGSSLMGPINKLQNALSFNYFANTQVYDPRADYISKDRPTYKDKDGKDIPVAESESGYYLNNGILSKTNTSEEITTEDLPLNPPEVDQVKTQDSANAGIQVSGLTTASNNQSINDKDVIGRIGIVGVKAYQFDNAYINPVFSFSTNNEIKSFNLDSTLNKTYKGQVYVKNDTNHLMTNLGYVSIRSNGVNNGVVFKSNIGLETELSPNVNGSIQWNIVLGLDDTQNAIVSQIYQLSGSILSIEWETGLKNNAVFGESYTL